MSETAVALQGSNFDLKRSTVDLIGVTRTTGSVTRSVSDLEAARVGRDSLSASKFGLETITGASCETGAQ